MKNFLILILLLLSINIFAQDWDDNKHEKKHKHEKYKKDYFTVGLYTGSYIGKGSAIEANDYLNSISAEIEYFKFSDLSIYVKGLYRFSKYRIYSSFNFTDHEDNSAYVLIVGFGGRYYVKKDGKVKPYLQVGINQETEYLKSSFYQGSYQFRYFMNIGVGFTLKISHAFNFDMKYDLNKTLDKDVYYSFNGFSVLAGLKYNL